MIEKLKKNIFHAYKRSYYPMHWKMTIDEVFKLLDQDAVGKLRAAKPDTTYEFSNKEVGVFYVVPATGEPHRTDGG